MDRDIISPRRFGLFCQDQARTGTVPLESASLSASVAFYDSVDFIPYALKGLTIVFYRQDIPVMH